MSKEMDTPEDDYSHLLPSEIRKQREMEMFKGNMPLDKYSVEELTEWYKTGNKMSAILKGRILLAIREHYKSDDRAFGQYLKRHDLDDHSHQTRLKYMKLAQHFAGRDMHGMSMTVCSMIAEVRHTDRAMGNKLIEEAQGANWSKLTLERRIKELKGIPVSVYVPKKTFQEEPAYTLPAECEVKPGLRVQSYKKPEEPIQEEINEGTYQEIPLVNEKPEDKVIRVLAGYEILEQVKILQKCISELEEKFINGKE